MSDADRNGLDNLVLLCPNHSRLVDHLEPDNYPVERLQEMKQRHDARVVDRSSWATEQQIEAYAKLAVDGTDAPPTTVTAGAAVQAAYSVRRADDAGTPRLTLRENSDGSLDVINEGSADAYAILVQPMPGSPLQLAAIPPGVLEPGAEWRAGGHLDASTETRPHGARLKWSNGLGETYSIDVQLP